MKKRIKLIAVLLVSVGLFSCEQDIFPELETAPPQLVVDAFLTNNNAPQCIRLAQSLPYYQADVLTPVRGATITVSTGSVSISFIENEPGMYCADIPSSTDFYQVGQEYTLLVETNNTVVTSSVTMNRVPDIDTIEFKYEEERPGFNAEGYIAQFFAVDPEGPGDTYWIKTFKNNAFLNKPSEINVAYDAAFSAGGNVDGQTFILPIRQSINPQDEDADGDLLPAYSSGDSIRVEIHSISNDAFDFFLQAQEQIDRPGGFGELFAVPLANLPTNLEASGAFENRVVGFFNVAAVSEFTNWLDPNNLPPKNP